MQITSQELLAAAQEIKQEILTDRRTIHQHPEVGTQLPITKAYVIKRLIELGYEPQEVCDSGVVATITGKDTGRCILLRADMDALHIQEQTDLDFKSQNDAMHACGHDMHTAMLLGAANLLRQYQAQINGTVKLVFQPDEEGFTGAKSMLAAG
uniref:M20 metallopeptidase family protein n=1 Tax=Butyricicoccus sp. TaxID=2049021 RepID=UPI003D7EADD2